MVSLREMARLDAARAPPVWLRPMLEMNFFEPCPRHPPARVTTRSAGCNFFCTQCTNQPLCFGCLGEHAGHQLIQIRRSSGHDAVRLEDVEHLLNVSLVQPYIVNTIFGLFLNQRPMAGQGKRCSSHCEECNRGLQEGPYRFCSLGCMVKEIEDGLDFSVSFAISSESDSSEEELDDGDDGDDDDKDDDDDDDDYSSHPTKFPKLEISSASSSKIVARGREARQEANVSAKP